MSFRDRMKVKVSNAEFDINLELQDRGLMKGLTTQKAFIFNRELEGVAGTWVDFYWDLLNGFACFIDYEKLHKKLNQSIRDDLVNKALKRRKVLVLRLSYERIPLSKKRRLEIVDSIEGFLNKYFFTFRSAIRMIK